MDKTETKNAVVSSTMLGWEDHGILTFMLCLDYGGSSQGAGGYCLDTPVKDAQDRFLCRRGTAAGMELVAEVMRVVGVEKWEDLKGRHVRVRGGRNKIEAIGHFLKEEWLDFEKFWAKSEEAVV